MIEIRDREDLAILSAYEAGRRDVLDAVEDELRRVRSWAIGSPPGPGYRVIARLREYLNELRGNEMAATAGETARPQIDTGNPVASATVATTAVACQEGGGDE